jgi:hypothetical protein
VSPGGHLVTTTAACAAVYAGTGSAALSAGLFAGGFLIDVDHVFDYVVFERQRDLRASRFMRHYMEGRVQRVVLLLHSYELMALLAWLAWTSHSVWLCGYVLGMALHLPLDIIWNGRLVPGGLGHFYSFAVRWRAGFRAAHFADPRRLAPVDDGFWRPFFRGARLRGAPSTASCGALAPNPRSSRIALRWISCAQPPRISPPFRGRAVMTTACVRGRRSDGAFRE